MALSLEVLRDDAVVADQGIGLGDNLPGVAGIRQGLQIAAHTGGEHQLTHRVQIRAEADSLEHPAVL